MNDKSNRNSSEEREESLKEIERHIAELYAKMQSPKHRQATDAFFRATADDLNSTYRGPSETLGQKE